MKRISIFLFMMGFWMTLKSQYVSMPTHYDAEHTANSIIAGNLNDFLEENVKYVFERKKEKYVVIYDFSHQKIKSKVYKVLKSGRPEFSSRTSGGYIFTITVVDPKDETNFLNYCTFHVDEITQKIKEIEILKGE